MALKAPANYVFQLYSVGYIASPGILLSGHLLSPVSTENMKKGVIIYMKTRFHCYFASSVDSSILW